MFRDWISWDSIHIRNKEEKNRCLDADICYTKSLYIYTYMNYNERHILITMVENILQEHQQSYEVQLGTYSQPQTFLLKKVTFFPKVWSNNFKLKLTDLKRFFQNHQYLLQAQISHRVLSLVQTTRRHIQKSCNLKFPFLCSRKPLFFTRYSYEKHHENCRSLF